MATAPIPTFTAQQVSHAIISAAMKVHTELGPACWKAPTQPACNTNSAGQGLNPPHRWAFLSFIVE
jgi:hypothetical protein